MARYHISPASGNPGVCRATKACPFGDSEEHFASPALARAYFEESQATFYPPTAEVHERKFTPKLRREAEARVAELVAFMKLEDGTFSLPEEQEVHWITDDDGEEHIVYGEQQLGDFKLFASGAAVNAYLHEPTSMVYKIPHFSNLGDDWSEDGSEQLMAIANGERENYEKLDRAKLEAENIAYVATYYFSTATTAGPLPVIAQPYLEPDSYTPCELTGTEQNRLAAAGGVWDLNRGNVRVHEESGRMILLDCVTSW